MVGGKGIAAREKMSRAQVFTLSNMEGKCRMRLSAHFSHNKAAPHGQAPENSLSFQASHFERLKPAVPRKNERHHWNVFSMNQKSSLSI
jgi:hypothetical protein